MENASETRPSPNPPLTDHEIALLARLDEIAQSLLIPRAEAVDMAGEVPRDNLQALARAGLVGVTTPTEWGGQACSGTFLREYTERLTAACGTTWFVLTQHLGSCSTLAGSQNPLPREQFLRAMANGDHWVGVGFGHLRRPQPMLRAEKVDGGYVLNGVAPWVTGWPILSGVILGAVMASDEGRHVYLYAPAVESEGLRSTPPLPLCAMNATATTEVQLTDLFLPDENWLRFSSRDEMARGDLNGIAGAVAPPLGCARGSLRVLRDLAAKRSGLPEIARVADALEREIDTCRSEARRWADGPKDTPDYKAGALAARAGAILLATRAAHSAVAAAGGAANDRSHPAQRLFREAMFYTLTAQTGDVRDATLAALFPPEQGA